MRRLEAGCNMLSGVTDGWREVVLDLEENEMGEQGVPDVNATAAGAQPWNAAVRFIS